jgi:mono/diheme cytochrome c family protein
MKRRLVMWCSIFSLLGGISAAQAGNAEIEKGKNLYMQNCQFCHQPDAIGKPGFAPSLTNKELLSISSDKFYMATIRDGRTGTGMPPFAHLGKGSVNAIIAYLRSFATLPDRSAAVDAQRKARGNANKGKVRFDEICSTCHGVKGDGYIAGGTGTAIGKAGFLDKASDGFIRVTIREGRTNTRMLGFSGPTAIAALEDQEIEDIIVYMRTLR